MGRGAARDRDTVLLNTVAEFRDRLHLSSLLYTRLHFNSPSFAILPVLPPTSPVYFALHVPSLRLAFPQDLHQLARFDLTFSNQYPDPRFVFICRRHPQEQKLAGTWILNGCSSYRPTLGHPAMIVPLPREALWSRPQGRYQPLQYVSLRLSVCCLRPLTPYH